MIGDGSRWLLALCLVPVSVEHLGELDENAVRISLCNFSERPNTLWIDDGDGNDGCFCGLTNLAAFFGVRLLVDIIGTTSNGSSWFTFSIIFSTVFFWHSASILIRVNLFFFFFSSFSVSLAIHSSSSSSNPKRLLMLVSSIFDVRVGLMTVLPGVTSFITVWSSMLAISVWLKLLLNRSLDIALRCATGNGDDCGLRLVADVNDWLIFKLFRAVGIFDGELRLVCTEKIRRICISENRNRNLFARWKEDYLTNAPYKYYRIVFAIYLSIYLQWPSTDYECNLAS